MTCCKKDIVELWIEESIPVSDPEALNRLLFNYSGIESTFY
jgi:hypothetical protein